MVPLASVSQVRIKADPLAKTVASGEAVKAVSGPWISEKYSWVENNWLGHSATYQFFSLHMSQWFGRGPVLFSKGKVYLIYLKTRKHKPVNSGYSIL